MQKGEKLERGVDGGGVEILKYEREIVGIEGEEKTYAKILNFIDCSTVNCQPIADSGFGEEEFWIGRIVFEFLT